MALSLDGTTGISATGNIISSAGIISATGNIYGGNIIGTLVVSTATFSGNVTSGNLLTGGIVSATANITGGNLLTAGLISAAGTITTGGDHSLTGNIVDTGTLWINTLANGNINLNVNGTGQTNIPTGILSVTGNIQGGNLRTAGLISATGTVTGSSILGSVVSVTANVTGGNLLTAGLISATGNVTGNYLLGNGTFITGLSASKIFNGTSEANIGASGGNANITIGGTANVLVVASTGAYVTGLTSTTGNVIGGNLLTAGLISATGAITGAGITGTSLTVSTGNVTLGNIINANGNAVGNIGSTTNYFNTVFGKATTAQYADLAELYAADADYTPGSVLSFGGAKEVTISTVASDTRVAGVVSTNPAHLMNSVLDSEHRVAVALTGRVPTSVTGTVRKGDMMVSAGNGHAQASAAPAMGTVIGKALQDFDGASGVIEVVVGRL